MLIYEILLNLILLYLKCITISGFDCLSLFLFVCLCVCPSVFLSFLFLIFHSLSLSAYLSDSLSMHTWKSAITVFPPNVFLIPSFRSFFPLTLTLHRNHIDYAVMILIFWWSRLISILTFNNIDTANFVWIALNLVGFDLICYISSDAILHCSIVLWSASLR